MSDFLDALALAGGLVAVAFIVSLGPVALLLGGARHLTAWFGS